MPTKAKVRATKNKQLKHRIKTYNFFLIFAIVLGMIAGVILVKLFYRGEGLRVGQPTVSLGVLEYKFVDGRAIKQNTPETTSLRAFLQGIADKDCSAVHSFMEPSKFTVIAATKDLSQVLLGYGCGDLSARMFAVYENGSWRTISPTNHFDEYNIPECSYLDEHKISKQITPVCYRVSKPNQDSVYSVR